MRVPEAARGPAGAGWGLTVTAACRWVPLVLAFLAWWWPHAVQWMVRSEVDGRPVPRPPQPGPEPLLLLLLVAAVVVLLDRQLRRLLGQRCWNADRSAAAGLVMGSYVTGVGLMAVVIDPGTAWVIANLLLLTAPGVLLVVRDGSSPWVALGRLLLGVTLVPLGFVVGALTGFTLGILAVLLPLGPRRDTAGALAP